MCNDFLPYTFVQSVLIEIFCVVLQGNCVCDDCDDNNALENGHQQVITSGSGGKKTWPEIRRAVCDFRQRLGSVSVMSISHVSFRHLQNGKTRVYFLSAPVNEFETLLYVDLPNQGVIGQLPWQPLIEPNFPNVIMTGQFSREEQLLSERKRLTTFGITSYEVNSESGRIVFPAASTLFHFSDNEYSVSFHFIIIVSYINNYV